ncbi:MAG: LysM domain-containing protein [Verrucomicrobia bacterium]|nr:LysM domain-containing protein [Verrucomicrobiota bacterium]
MFDTTSRYSSLEVRTFAMKGEDGEERSIRYTSRRFIPDTSAGVTLTEHAVTQGDRLDNITARTLGDPLLFWRIADANLSMEPQTLCDEPGSRVIISLPSA